MRPTRTTIIYVLLFLLAAGVRCIDVWRPVDGSMRDSWREPDVAGMARNFYEEGMNPLYPRIDWRGDGPGFTESELPLYPWVVACLYHAFGFHEELLRVVSYALFLAATAVFFRLAHERLSATGSLVACGLFAVNPLAARLATSIQPEPLMFLGYLSAIWFFLRWCDSRRGTDYWLAVAATALAILGKIPAIHIGIVFAGLCFQHFGLACLRRRDVWVFALTAVGIPAGWYVWSHTHWLQHGNSLGMSNEAYLRITSGNFLQALSLTLPGNLSSEIHWVWTRGGALLGVLMLPFVLRRPADRWLAWWGLALTAYYLVAGRTTSESWATHYHIVSVPYACLMLGYAAQTAPWHSLASLSERWRSAGLSQRGAHLVASAGVWLLILSTAYQSTRYLKWDLHPHGYQNLYECAQLFQPHIEPGSRVICSGAGGVDQFGLRRAYNVPYFFYWTHSKGFSLTDEDQTLEHIEQLRQRGAGYYIAERRSLVQVDRAFEAGLRSRYQVLAEHNRAILVRLTEPPAGPASGMPAHLLQPAILEPRATPSGREVTHSVRVPFATQN